MENTNVLFDRKRLVRLIVPLIVEQVLAVTVGMADMVMVSGAGETAVSGISLVNTICVLLIVIFTSMASGGSVVGAQFLGSGDKKTACHAAEQLVMICGLIALVICGISFFGNRFIRFKRYFGFDFFLCRFWGFGIRNGDCASSIYTVHCRA